MVEFMAAKYADARINFKASGFCHLRWSPSAV